LIDHPCFPCHGSYFIVGPAGDVFDCLLLNRTQVAARSSGFVDALTSAGTSNEWYALTTEETSTACRGCRYERVCKGQCANDRANASAGEFGRDLSACSLLPRAEREIWSQLPDVDRRALSRELASDGFVPAMWSSLSDIVVGAPSATGDVQQGEMGAPVEGRPVVVRFHQADVDADHI